MKKRLNLKQLKVKSFITEYEDSRFKKLHGGVNNNVGQVIDISDFNTFCIENCPASWNCTHTCPPTVQEGCGDTIPSPTDGCGGLSDNTCVIK